MKNKRKYKYINLIKVRENGCMCKKDKCKENIYMYKKDIYKKDLYKEKGYRYGKYK